MEKIKRKWKKDIFTASGILSIFFIISSTTFAARANPIIIDHNCIDITRVPNQWITQAKTRFKAAYGHTSHGSQIVSGMEVLKEKDVLYDFSYSGADGGLSLHDGEPSGDLGNPDRTTWANRTRTLLNNPDNNRNMIMWSWCGQADTTSANIDLYLNLMNQLESDYPDVTFVYMTGHLNGSGEQGNLNVRNNRIRQFCNNNNKVLFDFADIESYDPDGNYFLDRWADDGCNYDGGNWAVEWCAANPGECSTCSCAHSESLNCDMKGRAFWWMMARLSGWDGGGCLPAPSNLTATPSLDNQVILLSWTDNSGSTNEDGFIIQRQVNSGAWNGWNNNYANVGPDTTSYQDTNLPPGTYQYRVVAYGDDGYGAICYSAASNIAPVFFHELQCPIEATYGESSEETRVFRDYRDSIMSKTSVGRAAIGLYYKFSPFLTGAMRRDERIRVKFKAITDAILPALVMIETQ